jgi:glutathione S-transferase
MDINEATAAQSKQHIRKALQRINEALIDKKFLVGDRFSRADLTASALLAPLFMPAKYGLSWPQKLPEPLQSEIDEMSPHLQWAKDIYAKHR